MSEIKRDDMPKVDKIDLIRLIREFLLALRKLFWLPILLAVLLGAYQGYNSWRSFQPYYMSEATLTIQIASSGLGASDSYYNKETASQLEKTFPYIVQSELLQATLREEMGVSWINGSITANVVTGTNLFSIKVTSNSAEDAYNILNAVIEYYPKVADYVIGKSVMTVLAEPVIASEPFNTNDPLSSALKGGVAGFAAGILIVMMYAVTRRTIRSTEDVKNKLNQSCIASLPKVRFKKRSEDKGQIVGVNNPRVGSGFMESMRSFRVKFLRKLDQNDSQVVMVTSTVPGEGKTTVSANLALTLGQSGVEVILVDLDLRKPSVKEALGITKESRGVPEILESGKFSRRSLIPIEGTTMSVLAGDVAAAAPKNMMESKSLAMLIRRLRELADVVILDTPPCGVLADSAAMAKLADASVYVVRAGRVQVPHIIDGLQFVLGTGKPVLGCVLNDVNKTHSSYGKSYGYGYKSSYGRGYGYGGRKKSKYQNYDESKQEEAGDVEQ